VARRTRQTPTSRRAALLALCGLALAATPAAASMRPGEGFGTQRLGVPVTEGPIRFAAPRAWLWRHPEDGGPTTTQRFVLDGGVRVRLAGEEHTARRAVVWLQRVGLTTRADGTVATEYQVFVLLDDAVNPTAAAGAGSSRLVLQGRIVASDPVTLRLDVREPGPPRERELAALAAEGESLLAAALADDAPDAAPTAPRTLPVTEAFEAQRRQAEAERARLAREAADVARTAGAEPPRAVLVDADRSTAPGAAPTPPADAPSPRAPAPRPADTPRRAEVVTPLPPPPPQVPTTNLFTPRGTFFFQVGDRVVVQSGTDFNAAIMTGGVVATYTDRDSGRTLELKAERAVVFLQPGRLTEQFGRLDAQDVQGVYLEGQVLASDGTYTARAPQVYYDVASSQGLLSDAVLYTYEPRSGMPLYVRAAQIRQKTATTFSVEKARLDNTALAQAPLVVGVRSADIEVFEDDRNDDRVGGRMRVDAKNITLLGRAGGTGATGTEDAREVPLLWWPRYKGDPEQFPLRNIQVEDTSRRGTGIRTEWNAFSLLGINGPRGVDADLKLDYFSDSGFGLGAASDWNRENAVGSLNLYTLPNDEGNDLAPNGTRTGVDGEFRGVARFENLIRLNDLWQVRTELGWISDERFLESFSPGEAETTREVTNRLHVLRTEGQSVFFAEVKAQANDFIAPQWLLQTPGYSVDKVPELGFMQVARDVLPLSRPGLLTWTWEATAAQMRLRFSEVNAADYGYTDDDDALFAFGTLADESLGDALRATGLDESFVTRLDTRHELALNLTSGPLRITPFVVGRVTAYDSQFPDFGPTEEDRVRLWGAGGLRVGTELSRISRAAESRLLDIREVRHIIEPSMTVWGAGSSIARGALPVYDADVEDLADGFIFRAAVDQTWQTKRGAPGRDRTVDVFRLDTEYVYASDRADRGDPIGRFVEARPELSNPGEFARVRGDWQMTEVVGLAGESIYDFEANRHARTSAGVLVRHDPRFTTSFEVRWLEPADATYADLVLGYTLTDKYRAWFRTSYNFDVNDFQSFTARVERNFPNGVVGVTLDYDNIRGETSLGFIFRPLGLRRSTGLGLGSGGTRFGG
jgi:hypothetical protein